MTESMRAIAVERLGGREVLQVRQAISTMLEWIDWCLFYGSSRGHHLDRRGQRRARRDRIALNIRQSHPHG